MNEEKKSRRKIDRRRSKDVRTEKRITELRDVNRSALEGKVRKLEASQNLDAQQKKVLMALKSDLQFIEKNSLGRQQSHDDSQKLGKRSIFYDEDWNPNGEAPQGHRNVPYNRNTFTRKDSTIEPQLAGLEDLVPPLSRKKQ